MHSLPFETYLNKAPYAFFRWSNQENWPVIYASQTAESLLGYSVDEWLSGKVIYSEIIHPDDLNSVIQEVTQASQSGKEEFVHAPYRIQKKSGKWIWVNDFTQIIRKEQGAVIEYYGFIENFTDFLNYQTQAEKATLLNEQMSHALDQSNLISRSDKYGNFTYVNDHLLKLTGYTRQELIGKPHNILRHPDTPKKLFKKLWQTIQVGDVWKGRLKNCKKNGETYYVDMTIVPLKNSEGELLEYLAIRHEVTYLMTQQQELEKVIYTSQLLGIPNRNALLKDIPHFNMPKLAMLDIDDFRQINEYFGQEFGDKLLVNFMQQVNRYKPKDAHLYHFHADQFILTCDKTPHAEFIEQIKALRKTLSGQRFNVQGQDVLVNITLAISLESTTKLLNTLEVAMNHAKKTNRDFVQFTAEIDVYEQRAANLKWSEKLNEALEDDRITTFFQPIMCTKTLQICKHEALVRMIEPNGDIISPYFFLEVSKKTKKYSQLSRRVVSKTFETYENLDDSFSINISASDILNPKFIDHLLTHLENFPSPQNIIFEILESEEITDFTEINQFIDRIRQFGCKFAIDDFGAGYANFSNILNLQPDILKLDASLIKNLATDPDAKDIVEAIVTFAKKKGILTTAEFVFDEATFLAVQALEIDFAQGFFIGKPAATPTFVPEPSFILQ